MSDTGQKYLPNSSFCFVCGEDNPAGLQARFVVEDGVVKLPLRLQEHHCGYKGVAHGGITAAAMDECMGWAAARAVRRMCVTAELTVRYLGRVPTGVDLEVRAEVVCAHRLLVNTKAEVVDGDGRVCARSEGKFKPLSVKQTLEVDDVLLYRGDEERVFDELRAGEGGVA